MLPIKRTYFKLVLALYFYHIFDNIRKGYDNLKPGEENLDCNYLPIYLVLFENQNIFHLKSLITILE
jgi:hypothetical protein